VQSREQAKLSPPPSNFVARRPAADHETARDALHAFDRQRRSILRRHLTLSHSTQALIANLAHAVLRENAGARAYQMLDAEVRQVTVSGDTDSSSRLASYLAVHSPTERAALDAGGKFHHEANAC
jgi:hypothetical protein